MIDVRDGRLGRSVYATGDFAPGEILARGWGELSPHRSRHSIQIDFCEHVVAESPILFLNHSCEPNAGLLVRRGVQILEVHALRPITGGEEVTIDYAAFEYEILFFDHCLCGAPGCRGRITGYKDLPTDSRLAYGRYVAEYLLDLEPSAVKAG
jgi:hypothetical protein